MTPARRITEETFTQKDRLLLLQLSSRRAVAERREREESPSDEGDRRTGLPTAKVGTPPDRWELVPKAVELFDWQKECLEIWLQEARGTVKVATGAGKTRLALAAAERLQNDRDPDLRLVVVVPTIPLMYQWQEEFLSSNLPFHAIGLLGGSRKPPSLSELRVLLCVINSARARLPAMVRKAGWSPHMLLVVDECHRSNAVQAQRIFRTQPRYTLGLSATPEQDVGSDGMNPDEEYARGPVGRGLGPIIYEFSIRQSLEAGLLTPFEVWHIGLSLSSEEAADHGRISREITDLRKALQVRHRRGKSKQAFLAWCQAQASRGGAAAADAERFMALANRRKRLLYHAAARREVAMSLLGDSSADAGSRAIVFHESIEETERLFLEALKAGVPAVLEHSQLPDSLRAENIEAFRTGIARTIVSAKSLVEGFNVPSADLGIIAASSSSVRQRIQSLGRMLRRKPGARSARIVVLYVRDTEDEAIYERADWEDVVGTERNRYFHWSRPVPPSNWDTGLEEVGVPPRKYRPPSSEVDTGRLDRGDSYPGQTQGTDLKVDHAMNLRTEDDQLVPAPKEVVQEIVARSPFRRARVTPVGHLIVRVDPEGAKEEDWKYLGELALPAADSGSTHVRLRVRSSSGKRVIALEEGKTKLSFALGPEMGGSEDAGKARDYLLAWIAEVEAERGIRVTSLSWDGARGYWIEFGGERIEPEGPLSPLEFRP